MPNGESVRVATLMDALRPVVKLWMGQVDNNLQTGSHLVSRTILQLVPRVVDHLMAEHERGEVPRD